MAFSNNTDTPIFVQNQILRADDLNAMVKYFEDQVRLTRIFTIGIGARGLEISYNNDTHIFTISTGLGISSDGILFQLDQPCEFSYYKKTVVSERAFRCSNDGRRGSCADVNDRVTVFELLTELEEEAFPLINILQEDNININLPGTDPAFTNDDLCVILLHCEDVVNRRSCFNDCEQSGADRLSQTRVLLVPNVKLNPIAEGEGEDTTVQVDIDSPPSIHRFGYGEASKLELSAINDWASLYRNYLGLISIPVIGTISAAINSAHTGFYNLILPSDNPFSQLEVLLNDLQARYMNPNNPPNLSDIQYFYSFFRDLILAYEEFYEAACGLSVGISTGGDEEEANSSLCAFPGYVALGRFRNRVEEDCRTPFIPAAASKEVNERQLRAEKLYKRLIDMVTSMPTNPQRLDLLLKPGELSNENLSRENIRVTGSCTQKFDLSRQAIPFYFKLNNVQSNWIALNPNCNLSHRIRHYERSELSQNALLNKLDVHDFYRIEGHLGIELGLAEGEIEDWQSDLNLPFDIRSLRLGIGSTLENLFEDNKDLYFGEMQEVYQNTQADLLCKIEEFVDADGNLPDSLQAMKQLLSNTASLKDLTEAVINALISYEEGFEISTMDITVGIFRDLLKKYNRIKEDIEKSRAFVTFAAEHPGMEHLGGVPSGGTFILVYSYLLKSDQRPSYKRIYGELPDEDLIARAIAEPNDDLLDLAKATDKIVVADFCLPYSCCSNTPVIRNEFKQPNLQLFIDDRVCYEPDMAALPFAFTPEGGSWRFFIGSDEIEAEDVIGDQGQSIDIVALIAAAQEEALDFVNGRLELKLQYQVGNQLTSKKIIVLKKPDVSQLECEKGEPILNQEGMWVGFKYSFVHRLIDAEVDRATIKIGHLPEEVLDTSIPSLEKEIRIDQEGFRLPVEISLYAENGSCKERDVKLIEKEEFCKQPTLEMLSGCSLDGEEVDDQMVLTEVKCSSATISPGPDDSYALLRDGENAFVRLQLDCPGGSFTIKQEGDPLEEVNENFPENLLLQTSVPKGEGNQEIIYLFVFDAKALSNEDANLLDVIVDDLLFEVDEPVIFSLTYTPPTPCADNELTFRIKVQLPEEPEPDPNPDPVDEDDVEAPEERRGDGDIPTDEVIVVVASPNSVNKELPAEASKLLNARSAALRKQLIALESDKGLVRTKVFGLSKSFLILPAKDLTGINKRFEELAKALHASLSRAKGQRRAALHTLIAVTLQDFLDKQITLSPTLLPTQTETILKAMLPKWKKLGFKVGPAKKAWNPSVLKKALSAPVIDEIQKQLK